MMLSVSKCLKKRNQKLPLFNLALDSMQHLTSMALCLSVAITKPHPGPREGDKDRLLMEGMSDTL
jgi:hypothetical protein